MEKVLLLSNMYPSQSYPSFGIFIKNFEKQMIEEDVQYNKIVMTNTKNKYLKLAKYLFFFCHVFFTLILKNYDIVYIHYASITSIPVLWALKFKKITVYTNVHGTDVMASSDKEKKLEKNTRKICERSEKIIVPSEYFKEVIRIRYAVNEVEIITYPSGGVDQTVFYPKIKEKIKHNNDTSIFTIGFVSRIEYEKGWQTLLEGVLQFKEVCTDVSFKLVIIGEGSQSKELSNLIRNNNMDHFVKELKFVSQTELNDLYNQMDVFIFPSRKESLGLVALEAMSCAVPVIGSNIPAISSYVKEDINGYLFEKDNAEELAVKLIKFYELSLNTRDQMKSNALKTSLKYNKINSKDIFRDIFNLY